MRHILKSSLAGFPFQLVKGKRGERELAAILKEYGYNEARRGQQYCGADGSADVIGLPGIHIEAKQLVCQWIAAELWSRSFFSIIWRKSKEALLQLYVSWKYKGLFDIMRTAAEKYN